MIWYRPGSTTWTAPAATETFWPGDHFDDVNTNHASSHSTEVERNETDMGVWDSSSPDVYATAGTEEEEVEWSDIDATDIIDDKEVIGGIMYLAKNAEKTHVFFDKDTGDIQRVPVDDNPTRLEALKTLAKMKWLLSDRIKKKKKNTNIKYILVNDVK